MGMQDKTVLVTGAAGGIGQAIVEKFLSEGANVLAVDRAENALSIFANHDPKKCKTFTADVTDIGQIESAVNYAADCFGQLDIMINNAGIAAPKPLMDHEPERDFDAVTQVNQNGVYYGILCAGRQFKKQNTPGVILNTSSVYGLMAAEMTFSYNVSKAAVDMMTKCAALELAPHNIRVCAVAPGRVDTPMLRQYEALGLWEHIRKEQMRQAFTKPIEIANVFAFLARDEANVINGCTVTACDGFENFKYPLMG